MGGLFAKDTGEGFRLVMPMKDMGIDITIRNLVRGWNAFTILRFTFVDPELGTAKPVPYAFGSVKLDGADTVLTPYIESQDESKVKTGGPGGSHL